MNTNSSEFFKEESLLTSLFLLDLLVSAIINLDFFLWKYDINSYQCGVFGLSFGLSSYPPLGPRSPEKLWCSGYFMCCLYTLTLSLNLVLHTPVSPMYSYKQPEQILKQMTLTLLQDIGAFNVNVLFTFLNVYFFGYWQWLTTFASQIWVLFNTYFFIAKFRFSQQFFKVRWL